MEKVLFADYVKKGVQNLIKVPNVTIDDPIFRLNYKATGVTLFFCSLIVSGYQFFGNPIMCIQRDDIPEQLLNTYCWIEGTYTLPKALNMKVGEEVVHPGVGKYEKGDEVVEHAYYQWVSFVLFLQGVFFFTPYFLWYKMEGGRLKALIQKLKDPMISKSERVSNYEQLREYFEQRKSQHQGYAYKYIFCEFLNLVNVIGQIYFLNKFLGGFFTTYGADVVKYVNEEQENRTDPMIKLFPRITKCTFHKYGSSGDVQKHDALCLLPLNIINEKIFVILWFWYVILAVLGACVLIYRLIPLKSIPTRRRLLIAVSSLSKREDIESLFPWIAFGDWFILYMLADNIDNIHFRGVVLNVKQYYSDPKEIVFHKLGNQEDEKNNTGQNKDKQTSGKDQEVTLTANGKLPKGKQTKQKSEKAKDPEEAEKLMQKQKET